MIRCIKSHIEGGFFFTPLAATHIVDGLIYEISDRNGGEIRTNASWHPEECFEPYDKPLERFFQLGDKVRCIKEYQYFDYYDGFRLEVNQEYLVRFINGPLPEDIPDWGPNIDDMNAYHFFIGLDEDYSNDNQEAYYPEHYFELITSHIDQIPEAPITKLLKPKPTEEIQKNLSELPSESERMQALKSAMLNKHFDIVEYLIEIGVKVNLDIIEAAAEMRNDRIFDALIKGNLHIFPNIPAHYVIKIIDELLPRLRQSRNR